MKKLLTLAMILLGTQSAMAVETSQIGKVTRMFTYNTYTVLVLDGARASTAMCGNNTGKYVAFPTSDSAGKALYSAALTAFTTGTKIRFGQDGCINWSGGVPKVYRIEMIK
jgi:hypothetical protein